MKKGEYISAILRSNKTVFSFKDLALLWSDPGSDAARVRVNYYVKNGNLYHIRRGLYAKDKNYDRLELATRIFTPSYVSFETVLTQAGINFQFYEKTTIASYLAREIIADGRIYSYKKIKDFVLTNPSGVEHKDESSIATPERAFLDTIYIHKDYHFDNLQPLNWDKVFEMLPMYDNKRMAKKVKEFFEYYKKNQ